MQKKEKGCKVDYYESEMIVQSITIREKGLCRQSGVIQKKQSSDDDPSAETLRKR